MTNSTRTSVNKFRKKEATSSLLPFRRRMRVRRICHKIYHYDERKTTTHRMRGLACRSMWEVKTGRRSRGKSSRTPPTGTAQSRVERSAQDKCPRLLRDPTCCRVQVGEALTEQEPRETHSPTQSDAKKERRQRKNQNRFRIAHKKPVRRKQESIRK
jgi:hypothetical protein